MQDQAPANLLILQLPTWLRGKHVCSTRPRPQVRFRVLQRTFTPAFTAQGSRKYQYARLAESVAQRVFDQDPRLQIWQRPNFFVPFQLPARSLGAIFMHIYSRICTLNAKAASTQGPRLGQALTHHQRLQHGQQHQEGSRAEHPQSTPGGSEQLAEQQYEIQSPSRQPKGTQFILKATPKRKAKFHQGQGKITPGHSKPVLAQLFRHFPYQKLLHVTSARIAPSILYQKLRLSQNLAQNLPQI
ncbi:Hypothetical_protein [Hexamita inflata]|uniref:Hypothetical_protein n=1 Tax=Hexamita inflata TaxID=28002 RepID=A0AA86NXB8_9EUKA|nr:Hypothetical protein HINF_LOCUS14064 [Hexamita inflata]